LLQKIVIFIDGILGTLAQTIGVKRRVKAVLGTAQQG
jgi:hypothetical protein